MAAGLGFKTFTTGEVLTAADVNGYLMQGVLVFASEAARDAAITSPQEGQFAFTKDNNSLWYYTGSAWAASGATGDIEGVTAGTGISGGGTSGTVTITNSMATEITAKADLIVGTGNATFDNLPVGANGTVLTADSSVSPTGLKWAAPTAGAMTLISTTSLSGASITLSSIPSTYNNLVIILRDFELAASTPGNLQYQLNADTTANAHRQISQSGQASTSTSAAATGTSFTTVDDTVGFNPNTNYSQITIYDYANAVSRKAVDIINGYAGNTGNIYTQRITGTFTVTTAISSVKIALSAGTFSAGNALLYGVS